MPATASAAKKVPGPVRATSPAGGWPAAVAWVPSTVVGTVVAGSRQSDRAGVHGERLVRDPAVGEVLDGRDGVAAPHWDLLARHRNSRLAGGRVALGDPSDRAGESRPGHADALAIGEPR